MKTRDKLDIITKIQLFKKAIQEEQEGLVLNSILATRELNSEKYSNIPRRILSYKQKHTCGFS